MIHVSIVITHYSGSEDTRECLKSLQKIKHPHFRFSVIVVENGSKEPFEFKKSESPTQTVLIKSDSNLGFPGGNNLGIKEAVQRYHPDYVLLLNNDTTVDPQFLEELVKTAENNQDVGMVSPLIYFYPGREYYKDAYSQDQIGKVIWFAGGSIDWNNLDCFHRGVDEVDRNQFQNQASTDFATGCCVLVSRKVLDTVGLLDSRYFLYLEDVDWSLRTKSAKFKLLFTPKAKIWHKNAGSSGGSGSPLQLYYQTRNRLFFFTKYAFLKPSHSPLGDGIEYLYTVLRIWKFALKKIFTGLSVEQKGAVDWMLGKTGKQTVA